MKRVSELDEARKLTAEPNELILLAETKAAFKRWLDYYSQVIASEDLQCNACTRMAKLPTKREHRISFYIRMLYHGVVTLIRA